ncbi:MAG: VOC family protein [Sphaerochaetaceae bacterium]
MPSCLLDYCAIMVDDIESKVDLFSNVFGMHIRKRELNQNKIHQIWFSEGIQLTQCNDPVRVDQQLVNHIGIRVKEVDACLEKATAYGAKALAKGKNWIVFPFGLCVEVLPLEKEL